MDTILIIFPNKREINELPPYPYIFPKAISIVKTGLHNNTLVTRFVFHV